MRGESVRVPSWDTHLGADGLLSSRWPKCSPARPPLETDEGRVRMDHNLFNEICLQQLTFSGVHDGETIGVLTRGADRAEYADAFLWAAGKLGAQAFHLRLPAPTSTSGAWAVGDSGLAGNRLAVEALKSLDML